jgi:hypothetical protein
LWRTRRERLMNKTACKSGELLLRTGDLEVRLRKPEVFSERFAQVGVVEQVTLHGKHCFCQPEQKLMERATCHGVGLCSEFVWDELAKEAAPGEFFPKLGVGLLRQRPEGGAYDMWKHYEVTPFPASVHIMEHKAVFEQEPIPCMGVAARLTRIVEVCRNLLTITTTLENTGERSLSLQEYQHNFVAVDDLPVGPGYRLEIPFDGSLEKISESTVRIEDYHTSVPGVIKTDGKVILWKKTMNQTACHKVTGQEKILPCDIYSWKMSHDDCEASVSETVQFVPSGLVIWGIEHCMCAEVYGRWDVEPGERQTLVRTWRFEDNLTDKLFGTEMERQ